jgi:hypothetical protein
MQRAGRRELWRGQRVIPRGPHGERYCLGGAREAQEWRGEPPPHPALPSHLPVFVSDVSILPMHRDGLAPRRTSPKGTASCRLTMLAGLNA